MFILIWVEYIYIYIYIYVICYVYKYVSEIVMLYSDDFRYIYIYIISGPLTLCTEEKGRL